MRAPFIALVLAAAALGAPAFAQQPGTPVSGVGPTDTEKVKQIFVYGNDPCPKGSADEIVVCARLPDNERFRIPKDLRTDPNDPKVQSWANRARTLETAGAEGINSCSPTGGGGFTGCFQKLANAAREERRTMMGSATWADAVEKARTERLGNLDAESEEIEKEAKADEAEAARKAAQPNQQGPVEPR